MKKPTQSASAFIDERIQELGDWRGKTLANVRQIIHQADPEMVEELKWVKPTTGGTPVFSHGGMVCTGETYKSVVKLTFAKGAALPDPSRLFNSSLEGNVRRAIDVHEGDRIRSEEHTSELQSHVNIVCRLLPEKKKAEIRSAHL